MNEANPAESEVETQAHQVPWEEQFEDHENKMEEYIQNCIFRGGSVEGSIRRKAELQTLFRRIEIADATHPAGRRQLVVWVQAILTGAAVNAHRDTRRFSFETVSGRQIAHRRHADCECVTRGRIAYSGNVARD